MPIMYSPPYKLIVNPTLLQLLLHYPYHYVTTIKIFYVIGIVQIDAYILADVHTFLIHNH